MSWRNDPWGWWSNPRLAGSMWLYYCWDGWRVVLSCWICCCWGIGPQLTARTLFFIAVSVTIVRKSVIEYTMLQNTARILLQRQGGEDKLKQNLHRKQLNKCNNNKARAILAPRRTHGKRKAILESKLMTKHPVRHPSRNNGGSLACAPIPTLQTQPHHANQPVLICL